MKNCPICSKELAEILTETNSKSFYICRNNVHGLEKGFEFQAQYFKDTDELAFYRINIDNFSIENIFETNKTNILMRKNNGMGFKYEPILYLPLIHFELYDLESIKKKLKLLLMMI